MNDTDDNKSSNYLNLDMVQAISCMNLLANEYRDCLLGIIKDNNVDLKIGSNYKDLSTSTLISSLSIIDVASLVGSIGKGSTITFMSINELVKDNILNLTVANYITRYDSKSLNLQIPSNATTSLSKAILECLPRLSSSMDEILTSLSYLEPLIDMVYDIDDDGGGIPGLIDSVLNFSKTAVFSMNKRK